MAKSVNDYLSEIEEKTGFSSGNIQSAEEWLAEKDKREFADKIQRTDVIVLINESTYELI